MRVYRYSDTGFEPQDQSHHRACVLLELDEQAFEEMMERMPAHGISGCRERHERLVPLYAEHIEDFESGVWVFTSDNNSRMSLNHLKSIPTKWSAELPDDTIVWNVNLDARTTLVDCPAADVFGCYVPASSLERLSDVREEYNPYLGMSYKAYRREEDPEWGDSESAAVI